MLLSGFMALIIALTQQNPAEDTLQPNLPSPITLQGTILNLDTNTPFSNIKIIASENNSQTLADRQGQFILDDYIPNTPIELSEGLLYNVVTLIPNDKNITVNISPQLITIIDNINIYERQRQYKKLYSLLSKNRQEEIALDKYLQQKNDWRDELTAKSEQIMISYVLDYRSLKPITDNTLKADITVSLIQKEEVIVTQKTSVTFQKEHNSWKIDTWLPIILP